VARKMWRDARSDLAHSTRIRVPLFINTRIARNIHKIALHKLTHIARERHKLMGARDEFRKAGFK
jgi:hypothetical protein